MFILLVLLVTAISENWNLLPGGGLSNEPIIDTLIVVGNNEKLHIRLSRGGEPTILLESGGGADATQWNAIQQRLADETNATIVSYDRAGFGLSDLPTSDYDIVDEAENLHKALEALGTKSLIIVSHSYGAFVTQAYQHLYPNTVSSIILLDPNTVEFVDSVGVQHLSKVTFDTTGILTNKQKADVRQTRSLNKTLNRLRNMPYAKNQSLTVVAAGIDWWPFAQVNAWWRQGQENLVRSVSNGTWIIAEESAHNIPDLKPDLVLQLIKKSINE
jgi:pimeloyl-ACP methyl ester carboxylesterase